MRIIDQFFSRAAPRALLASTLAAAAGCAELARPSEAAAPPAEQPP